MEIELSEDARVLLNAANYAHLATIQKQGGPLVSPVWVALEGNRILIGTGEGTQKAKNTRREPRVALSIVDQENPYRQLQIRGEVIARRDDDDFVGMDAISIKYTGEPFPWRHLKNRVVLEVVPHSERLEEIPFVHNPQPNA